MWSAILGFLKPIFAALFKELFDAAIFRKKTTTESHIKETEKHVKAPHLDLADPLNDDLLSDDLV